MGWAKANKKPSIINEDFKSIKTNDRKPRKPKAETKISDLIHFWLPFCLLKKPFFFLIFSALSIPGKDIFLCN